MGNGELRDGWSEMNIAKITGWLDRELDVASFDDVSNNGVQIARDGEDVSKVAFAVDASLASVDAAVAAGAQLLVVHHGISWGGGMRRIEGGLRSVVAAAIRADLALYAVHLPLDANAKYGNNYEIARHLGLGNLRPAFSYHGNVIGVVGEHPDFGNLSAFVGEQILPSPGYRVGVCSGGAGEFAEDAKRLGCDLYVTGEASWGDVIAAENVGMKMACCGHYETETFGVRALAAGMAESLGVETVFLPRAQAGSRAPRDRQAE